MLEIGRFFFFLFERNKMKEISKFLILGSMLTLISGDAGLEFACSVPVFFGSCLLQILPTAMDPVIPSFKLKFSSTRNINFLVWEINPK